MTPAQYSSAGAPIRSSSSSRFWSIRKPKGHSHYSTRSASSSSMRSTPMPMVGYSIRNRCMPAPKKSGKTTFAAIYVITIVLLFGGAYPEAICAANDYEQSVGRVFAAIRRIVECSPLLCAEAKITTDKIRLATRS